MKTRGERKRRKKGKERNQLLTGGGARGDKGYMRERVKQEKYVMYICRYVHKGVNED